MREEKLLDFIGEVDCKYIAEANSIAKSKHVHWLRWCALAACITLCICGTLVGHAAHQKYYTEVSYICLDVNPSFELCLNHKDIVINAIAYNKDGEELLNKVDYNNKHYEDVIHNILHHEAFKKYLTQDLTITIIADDDTEISQNIKGHIEKTQCGGKVVCSNAQTREKAYSNHCSTGKYVAYEALSQYDQNITLEDCKGMTMHEIYGEIEKHHGSHHNDQNSTNHNTQSDHHSNHH